MMSWFADAHYYIALLNENDDSHARAKELTATLRGRFVTTQWVLVEVGGAIARPDHRAAFVQLVATLCSKPNVTVVEACDSLFQRGMSLFSQRTDKSWSLTDCISFVVMHEHRIKAALTADHHFEQAGFRVLLR